MGLTHDDFQEIKRMYHSGASPELTVREMRLKKRSGVVRDIERELTSLAPGSMLEYRSYLERMADDIEY